MQRLKSIFGTVFSVILVFAIAYGLMLVLAKVFGITASDTKGNIRSGLLWGLIIIGCLLRIFAPKWLEDETETKGG